MSRAASGALGRLIAGLIERARGTWGTADIRPIAWALLAQRGHLAAQVFQQCVKLRAGDLGALRYLAAIEQYRLTPPPDDWNAAIELTAK